MAKKKAKINKSSKRNWVVGIVLALVVAVAGYFLFNVARGVNDSMADTSHTIFKAQGYDVRACRPYANKPNVAYNGITSYVLATNNQAKSQFKKFIVEFTNTVDPSQKYKDGEGLATVKVFKNPYGVNANMTATIHLNNGGVVTSAPYAVFNIKPCPA